MNKKYAVDELEFLLETILRHGFSHMNSLRGQLAELDLTPEEIYGDDNTVRVVTAKSLTLALQVLNDVINHGYDTSLQLFPEKEHKVIKWCMKYNKSGNSRACIDKHEDEAKEAEEAKA